MTARDRPIKLDIRHDIDGLQIDLQSRSGRYNPTILATAHRAPVLLTKPACASSSATWRKDRRRPLTGQRYSFSARATNSGPPGLSM